MIEIAANGDITLLDDNDPDRVARILAFFGPPPRRLIAKALVETRLQSIGKLEAAQAALASDPVKSLQWLTRAWENVYFDDPGLLAILTGIGCTDEEIAEITA